VAIGEPGQPRGGTPNEVSVALCATGGTISCTTGPDGVAVPTLMAAELLASTVPPAGVRVSPIDVERWASWDAQLPGLLRLAGRVEELLAEHDAVVVTHGTDTLEEAAAFLHHTVRGDRPVIVTGAMRNASQPGADGPANLRAAFAVAAHPAAVGRGCLVVLGDVVFLAGEATKGHSSNPATFTAPGRGPVGAVDFDRVAFFREAVPRTRYAVQRADLDVPLIVAAVGMGARTVTAALAGADGLVVAGFGAGHLPAAWVAPLAAATAAGRPVVLTSRTGAGPVPGSYGGPGGDLDVAAAGVIGGGYRNPYAARMELVCALGAGLTTEQIRASFATT